jgi:4-amino-4-deoxy-L-arabinose transferase-like glycosyltransferase
MQGGYVRDLPFLAGAHGKGPLLVVLFFISATVVTVWGTWEGTLPASEESVRAEIAREILVTGDGWNMHFDSEPVDDVSPLPLWFMAASYRIFGLNEFSARFPFVLFSVLTFFLAYLMGMECGGPGERERIYINRSRATGLLSAIILAASPLFGRYAVHIFPAVPNALFAALALLGLLCLPGRRTGYILWAFGLAGSIIVSGSSGAALVVGALVACLAVGDRRRIVRGGWFWLATAAALAAGGYWLLWNTPPWGGAVYDNDLWAVIAGIIRPSSDFLPAFFVRIQDVWLRNLPWSIVVLIAYLRMLYLHGEKAVAAGIESADRVLALFVAVVFSILAFANPRVTEQFIILLPAAAVLAAREMTRWIASESLETTVSRLWSFNQAMVSLFCLLMLLLLATPLRLHKADTDPIKEIALMARQHTAEGEGIGNYRQQPSRIQRAMMLFYGGRSLDRPFYEPRSIADALEREPGKVFLSTFEDFRSLGEALGEPGGLHMIYRAGTLVLFSAGSSPEEVPR